MQCRPEWWNHPKAQQAVDFFSNLTLIGDYSGQRWVLDRWQEEWIRELYGKRNPDGSRKINKISLWMPRGLGKTQQAAGIAAYELIYGPPGREIYSAGPDRDKAGRLYKAMAQMIRADPHLERLCELSDYNMRIRVKGKDSVYQALAADSDQGHGLAPSTLILDELHLWGPKGRKLYQALISGFGKRKKGSRLEVQISTAGDSRDGLAYELYSYAKNVRDGVIKNPNMLVRIFEAAEDADWTDEEVWRSCMPCSFVDFDFIRQECEEAKHIKHKEWDFRQLYLGQWVERVGDDTWIAPSEWDACRSDYDETDLEGEECYAGLDLSSVRDLTALSLFFPRSRRVLSYSWLPETGLSGREDRDGVTYRQWRSEGRLFTTSGSRIVHSEVAEKINEILVRYHVVKLVADPYSLHLIATHLNQEVEKYPQSPGYMSPPSKWFESAVASREIRHDGNPLLAWCVGNTVVEKDKYENISPHKGKSRKRIDPCVALVMAIGAWLGSEGEESGDDFYDGENNYI